MRKIIITIVSLVVLIGLVWGGIALGDGRAKSASSPATSSSKTSSSQTSGKSRQLIIYFSLSGTTKTAAEAIQKQTNADMIRLQPRKAYPETYDAAVKVAQRELKTKTHPAIKTKLPDLSRYQTIYVGFPTLWRQPPMIIHSLFDEADFSGKTIVPFTTSMSTPMKNSMGQMQKMANATNAHLNQGYRYDNDNASLKRFLQNNELIK